MRRTPLAAALVAVLAIGALAGCGDEKSSSASSGSGSSGSGVSSAPKGEAINIGTIGSYSGAQAASLGKGPDVAKAWAKSVNDAGGINGHPVNRATPGIACVVADFDTGTRQIVDHLASYGHESLVFAGGPPESWSGARRWAGLRAAAEERGMTAQRFGPYSPTLAGGPAAADAVIAAGTTAVVCHNDMLAIGLMGRLAERGRVVPRDLSIVGFDDIFGADFCNPPLTTLAERTEDAGARAVETLVRQVPARPTDAPTRVLPTQLVVRASTGPAPTSSSGDS